MCSVPLRFILAVEARFGSVRTQSFPGLLLKADNAEPVKLCKARTLRIAAVRQGRSELPLPALFEKCCKRDDHWNHVHSRPDCTRPSPSAPLRRRWDGHSDD